MSPAEMDNELLPTFEKLKESEAAIIHYKTRSTAVSSPEIGSISKAIELGRHVFGSGAMPVLLGAPNLGAFSFTGLPHFQIGRAIVGAYPKLLAGQRTANTRPHSRRSCSANHSQAAAGHDRDHTRPGLRTCGRSAGARRYLLFRESWPDLICWNSVNNMIQFGHKRSIF